MRLVDDVCLIEEMGDIQKFFWVKWVSKVFLSICLFIEWQNDRTKRRFEARVGASL